MYPLPAYPSASTSWIEDFVVIRNLDLDFTCMSSRHVKLEVYARESGKRGMLRARTAKDFICIPCHRRALRIFVCKRIHCERGAREG